MTMLSEVCKQTCQMFYYMSSGVKQRCLFPGRLHFGVYGGTYARYQHFKIPKSTDFWPKKHPFSSKKKPSFIKTLTLDEQEHVF